MHADDRTTTHQDYPLSAAVPEELPEPTFWPIALAFGITLLFWGFLTSLIISAVGVAVSAVSIAGWIGVFAE